MSAIKRTVVEICILGALSIVLAFGVNAVRVKGHVKVAKNYFEVAPSDHPLDRNMGGESPTPNSSAHTDLAAPKSVDTGVVAAPSPSTHIEAEHPRNSPNPPDSSTVAAKSAGSEPAKPKMKHVDSPYKEISADQVLDVLKDSGTAKGLNVIVDARDDDHFKEGRIPGAIQSFPYEFDRFRDSVLNHVSGAEKVIVYCGGGDCEDSIFMCRELVEAGVPEESLYLFAGGFEEWCSRKLPLETSSE